MTERIRKRKLIEVALPLDEINAACAADKAVKTGTLRNLHKWFAPMPLPAWRAILFAALVDDPGEEVRRAELLDVVRGLVENGAGLPEQEALRRATDILAAQFPDGLPTVLDPFCGGGSTLVEAQRLGLSTLGSDLNPVPALITRTLTEVLPKAADASFEAEDEAGTLFAAAERRGHYAGVINAFHHYADWVMEEALSDLRPAYPAVSDGTVIFWLWGRTVPCTNPACGIQTVLTTTWQLSRKVGELAWVSPSVADGEVVLDVISGQRDGQAPTSPKVGRGADFQCLNCSQVIREADIRQLALDGLMGRRLIAVHIDTGSRRLFRAPTESEILAANVTAPEDLPEVSLGEANQYIAPPRYGIETFLDLYTSRQALALATFASHVARVQEKVITDGGSKELADAVSSLLGLAVGKMAQYNSTQTFVRTRRGPSAATGAFGRADLPMTWDFAETYPFGSSVGSWATVCQNLLRALEFAPMGSGRVALADARSIASNRPVVVATDPPYFDAIGYADLSDYFYMWHRRALRNVHPDLYRTIATPKTGELTAFAWHHGGTKDAARAAFIDGFTETFEHLQHLATPDVPLVIVYASKEQKGGREEETRWSSILSAMVAAKLEITGTWPIRGTTEARMRSAGSNAVSSYIAMVCRPRDDSAKTCSLADFARSLRRELSTAVRDLQAASILPVDLAQAAMGPGMQIYSRYRAVLDQAGNPVPVDHALRLINDALGEVLDEQEGELDPESRFAVRWWEAYGWSAASFGEADKAVRPLGISVDDVVRAQVATSQANKVQLLGRTGLDRDWLPSRDSNPTAWEAVHHLADRLIDGRGELEAGQLMGALANLQDPARALVYRLHDLAAKASRAGDQERYNALISAWNELLRLGSTASTDRGLF
ncbi:DUF1156 domain-containing protein [Microbacterium mitrae]|uniref:DUF1156 domain-containing protein n=1 Tax=Microbacterium mitrae TaxID=664640 RepID=UPI001650D420|nr:DUF1156 domain-containing protein [Microbacterium mitrae]